MAGSLTDPVRTVLPNGLTVVAEATDSAPVFTAMLVVEAGSRHDPADRAGLAALVGGLLLEGTTAQSAAAVSLAVDSMGSAIDSVTGYETTAVVASGLAEHCGETLDMLSEVVASPNFPENQVRECSRRQLSELAADEGQAYEVCRRSFMRALFDGHARGKPVAGLPETVERLTRADVVGFHGTNYVPGGAVLAVAGNLDRQRLLDSAAASFERWPEGGTPPDPRPLPPATTGRRLESTVMDSSQQHVIVGNRAIARSDPLFYATAVMDVILGDSAGFGSRLATRFREEQGLAYVIESDASGTAGLDPGVFWAYTATSPRNFEALVTGLVQETRRMRSEPPTEEELESAVGYLIGRDPMDRETADAIAGRLVHAERHSLGLDFNERFPGLVSAVTRDDVLEAARRVIDPDNCVLVTVGPVAPDGPSLLDAC